MDTNTLSAALSSLADDQNAAVTAANNVDFGPVRPEQRILNHMQQLSIPAKMQQSMNAIGLGKLQNLSIYFDPDGKPQEEALLLAVCKTVGLKEQPVQTGLDAMTNWTLTNLGKTILNPCPNNQQWWQNAIRTLLRRVKSMTEADDKKMLLATQHPHANPITPKSERLQLYQRIKKDLKDMMMNCREDLAPHHRILDKLDQLNRNGLTLPVWELKDMWLKTDKVDSNTINEKQIQADASMFALGVDRLVSVITINHWMEFYERLVSFFAAMAVTHHAFMEEVKTDGKDYLDALREQWFHPVTGTNIFHILELDRMIRREVFVEMEKDQDLKFFPTLKTHFLDKTVRAAKTSFFMATVVTHVASGHKRLGANPSGSGQFESPLKTPRTRLSPGSSVSGDEFYAEYQKLKDKQAAKNQRQRENKKARKQAEAEAETNGGPNPKPKAKVKAGAKGGGKGSKSKAKGAKGGARTGPANPQPQYPAHEHVEIQKLLKDPRNAGSGRCRFWNSSRPCIYGDSCTFKHECLNCGSTDHGLQACTRARS